LEVSSILLTPIAETQALRIIDRARVIERRIPQAKRDAQRALLRRETAVLWRRIALINWAIRLCVAGALAICLVIVALFVGELVAFNMAVAGDRARRRCRGSGPALKRRLR
jgi:hypothetical protein